MILKRFTKEENIDHPRQTLNLSTSNLEEDEEPGCVRGDINDIKEKNKTM